MTHSRWIPVLALAAFALPALADQASKHALAEEILTLTNAESMMQTILDQVRASMSAQVSQSILSDKTLQPFAKDLEPLLTDYQDKMIGVLKKSLNWADLKPRMTGIYEDMFSEEELASIVVFYKTPAGQALIKKLPDLSARSIKLSQDQVKAAVPEIVRLSQELSEKAAKIAADKGAQH